MLSYMSIERVEGDFAVCEVEDLPLEDSEVDDFFDKPCFMCDIPKAMFEENGFPIEEGLVFTVNHDRDKIEAICSIDEQERMRRIEILEYLLM